MCVRVVCCTKAAKGKKGCNFLRPVSPTKTIMWLTQTARFSSNRQQQKYFLKKTHGGQERQAVNKGSFVMGYRHTPLAFARRSKPKYERHFKINFTLKLQPTHLIARFLLGKNPKEATPAS